MDEAYRGMVQLQEQVNRVPRGMPSLDVADEVSGLDGSDFILMGYDPHPSVKFEVSP